MQPNYNVLQEIEWEMNVFPVWPVAAWTNNTFIQLLMRLNFHRFMFRQWCIDDFDFICNVWVKTLNLSIKCIFLPLSVAPVIKAELNQKRKIIVYQPWKLHSLVNVFKKKKWQPRKPKPVCLQKVASLSNQVYYKSVTKQGGCTYFPWNCLIIMFCQYWSYVSLTVH